MVTPSPKRLSSRVLWAVLSVYFVVALTLFTLQFFLKYVHVKNDIKEELAELENIFAEPLTTALWASTIPQIEALAIGITKLRIVTGIEIINKDSGLHATKFLTKKSNLFHRFQLFYTFEKNSVYLATVTVYSDSSVVLNRLKIGFFLLITQIMVLSVVLTVLFIWAIRKYLRIPLEHFSGEIESVTAGSKEGDHFDFNFTTSYAEFEPLVNVLQEMGEKIAKQFQSIQRIFDDLKKNHERLRTAQEIARLGNWDWDITTNDIYLSEETYRIFDLAPNTNRETYKMFLKFVHPDDRNDVTASIKNARHKEQPLNIKHRIVLPDGTIRIVHEQAITTFDDKRKPVRMLGFVQDITEAQELLEKLSASEKHLLQNEKDLQELAGRLLSVQEEERRRLARELHDDLAQRMALLVIEAGQLNTEECNAEAPVILQGLQDKLIDLSEDIHRISRQLHPSIIEDLGLVDAFRSEINNFSRLEEIPVKFEPEIGSVNPPMDIAVSLFRVTQESLRNIKKHAHAKNVTIQLAQEDGSLLLTISDDGRGFTPDIVRNLPGLGLKSMRERMRLINGSISYISRQGQGTTVQARVDMPS
ncbi:MAG: PAS domain-containing protein [Desulfobulbaceae bacterium]|nr:PAS domain-containing protein [Desulfobulbaceae bacterium]